MFTNAVQSKVAIMIFDFTTPDTTQLPSLKQHMLLREFYHLGDH